MAEEQVDPRQETLPGVTAEPPKEQPDAAKIAADLAEVQSRLAAADQRERELKHQLKQAQALPSDPDELLKKAGQDPDAYFWKKWEQMTGEKKVEEEVPAHVQRLKEQFDQTQKRLMEIEQQRVLDSTAAEFRSLVSEDKHPMTAAWGNEALPTLYGVLSEIVQREGHAAATVEAALPIVEDRIRRQGKAWAERLKKNADKVPDYKDYFSAPQTQTQNPGGTLSNADTTSGGDEVDTTKMTEKQRLAFNIEWARRKAASES